MDIRTCRAVLAALVMGAAGTLAIGAEAPQVRQAPQGKPVPVPAGASVRSLRMDRVHVRATNEVVGEWQDGVFCGSVGPMRFDNRLTGLLFGDLPNMARSEFDAAGHPPPSFSAFRSETQAGGNEYELAVTLLGMEGVLCHKSGRRVEGALWIKLDWELFSPIERRVIYQAQTEGSFHTGSDKVELLGVARRAVQSATRNLLADPRLMAELTRDPQLAPATATLPLLAIARAPAPGSQLSTNLPALRSAVVTLITGNGSGSGFYLNAQGYLLTNSHVVGDAKFLKVRLPSGREILGEVLRTDPRRDVALVKTEAVALAPVPVALAEPAVGAELTALGSPFGEKFESSMTRGILSGVRELDQQRWLQSDVTVTPGSSGGPLLDAGGAVVGLTTLGRDGVNLFVPIKEALAALRLEIGAP